MPVHWTIQVITNSCGLDLRDLPMNSRDICDPTGGEIFMKFNYEVSEHNSNNSEYIYGDPSHLSAMMGFLLKKMNRLFKKPSCSYQQ